MKIFKITTTTVLTAILINISAFGDDSFSALYKKAREKSFKLKAEYSKLSASEDGVAIAKARLYPSLNLTSSLNTFEKFNDPNVPSSLDLTNSLYISQVLFDRQVYYAINLSKLDLQRNKLQFQDQERKFAISFAQLYINVLTNRVQYLLLKKQYDIIDELVTLAHESNVDGTIKEALWTRLDPLSVYVNQTKTIFENSFSKLKAICGVDNIDEVFYADSSYNYVHNKNLGQAKLYAKVLGQAFQSNADIQMAVYNSQSSYKKYELEKLPPFSLRTFAGVSNHQSPSGYSDYQTNDMNAGIVFSMELDFGKKKRKEQQQKLYSSSLEIVKDVKENVSGQLNDTVNNLFAAYDSYERLNKIDARYHESQSRSDMARDGLDDIIKNFSAYSKDLGLINSKLSALSSYISTIIQDKKIKQDILVEELNIIQITGKLEIKGVIKEIGGILSDPYPIDDYIPTPK